MIELTVYDAVDENGREGCENSRRAAPPAHNRAFLHVIAFRGFCNSHCCLAAPNQRGLWYPATTPYTYSKSKYITQGQVKRTSHFKYLPI